MGGLFLARDIEMARTALRERGAEEGAEKVLWGPLASTIFSTEARAPKHLVGHPTAICDSIAAIPPYSLGIGNGVGKQGRGNQPPYRRYGLDTEIQYRPQEPHGLAKTSRSLSKREADTEFQTPHRRYGHRLRTPFLRTPFPRLLYSAL